MRAIEFLAEAGPEELQQALESWMEMESTPHDIQTILLSNKSKPFKKPPNIKWLYRAIVLKNRNINNIKSTSQVIAFATDIKGAINFVRSLDVYGDWVIIRKPFNAADFLLDFTSMYEAISQGAHHYGYVSESEVWMKPTLAYIGAKKSEIVLTSQDYSARFSEATVIEPALRNVFKIAYHITTTENANEILHSGLDPRDGKAFLVVDTGDQNKLRKELGVVANWMYEKTAQSDDPLTLLQIDITRIPLSYEFGWHFSTTKIAPDRIQDLGENELARYA